jgi:hypothetical protein
MNIDLSRKLTQKYPLILWPDRFKNDPDFAYGIECGDGWYTLIDGLCAAIQDHIQMETDTRNRELETRRIFRLARAGKWDEFEAKYHFGGIEPRPQDAWSRDNREQFVREKRAGIPPVVQQVQAHQIKEKFGGLRFYYGGGDSDIYAMVRMAEYMSFRMCEACGAPGKLRGGGWISTLCDEHAKPKGVS